MKANLKEMKGPTFEIVSKLMKTMELSWSIHTKHLLAWREVSCLSTSPLSLLSSMMYTLSISLGLEDPSEVFFLY